MNDSLQLGQHLDADTLSAFAEGALPAHERDQAAGHLAACAECRQVLARSLPEVEEMQPVAVLPARRGFAGWRWLWAGAAACAGVALASIALLHHSNAPATIARVETPATMPAAPVAVAAAPQALPLPKAPPLLTRKPALPPPKPAIVLQGMSRGSAGFVDAPARTEANGALNGAASASDASGPAAGQLAQAEPRRAPLLAPRARSADEAQVRGSSAAMAAPAPVASVASPVITAAAPPPAPLRAKAAAATGRASQTVKVTSDAAVAMDTTNAAVGQLLPELPSHLATASRFAEGPRVVAADTAGAVFFSEDGGRRWSAVKAPWHGRVVRVSAAVEAAPRVQASVPAAPLRDDARAGSAGLQGLVRDASGAVVEGASVEVSGAAAALHVVADRVGHYAVRGLAAGDYVVKVEMPGFSTSEARVTLPAAQQQIVNVTLQSGSVSETVMVAGGAVSRNPAAVFALTTSDGERWVSVDGNKWVRQ